MESGWLVNQLSPSFPIRLLAMRPTCFLLLFALATLVAHAIEVDSRVLTLAEMRQLGLEIEVKSLPGPKETLRHTVTVGVMVDRKEDKFWGVGYAILDRALDADFASPGNAGLRDSGMWTRQVRGEASAKPKLVFRVSDADLAFGYLRLTLGRAPRGGNRYEGIYYLPLSTFIIAGTAQVQPDLRERPADLFLGLPQSAQIEANLK